MVHRLALLLGAVGAAAVLALAMGLGGLLQTAPTAADTGLAVNGGDQTLAAAPATKTIIDKVYVEPTPAPVVVHVNKPPRNTAPPATVSRPRGGGERGDRGERGGD